MDPQVLENPQVFDSQLQVTSWLKPTWIQVWHFEFEIPMGTDPGHPRVHSCSPLHIPKPDQHCGIVTWPQVTQGSWSTHRQHPGIPPAQCTLRHSQINGLMVKRHFTLYLHKHAVIMAPYLQGTPILELFTHYTMPPVWSC